MIGFAFLIGRIPPWAICLLALAALLFNLLVIPAIGKSIYTSEDKGRGYSVGIIAYPAVVLFMSLIFYSQQIFLAIGWGALAFGDGFAGWIGSKWGKHQLFWNRKKSWLGSFAFIFFGILGTYLLIISLPSATKLGISHASWWSIIALAIFIASLVETIEGLIDDNISVCISASVFSFLIFHFFTKTPPGIPVRIMIPVLLIVLLMVLSVVAGKIDIPGTLLGGIIAVLILLGGGRPALLLLFVFFVLGSLASSYKKREKLRLDIAQEKEGKRSVRHAMSNAGLAGIFGLCAWWFPEQSALFGVLIACVFASAMGDTLSSEVGNALGKKFVNILSFRSGKKGEDGLISLEGSLAGILGSACIAIVYILLGGFSLKVGMIILFAGIFGNLMDSVLGASLQKNAWLTNDTVNFFNTLFAAGFGWLLWINL